MFRKDVLRRFKTWGRRDEQREEHVSKHVKMALAAANVETEQYF